MKARVEVEERGMERMVIEGGRTRVRREGDWVGQSSGNTAGLVAGCKVRS